MSTDIFERYDRGRIREVLPLLEGSDNPAAQVLAALTMNQPHIVLRQELDATDALYWYLRSIAAWRVGDALALREAVRSAMQHASPEEADELEELETFLQVAEAASTGKLRDKSEGAPRRSRFDPEHSHVITEVVLNGRAMRMLIDTGAELSILDAAVAAELGMRFPATGTVAANTNTGEVEMGVGLIDGVDWLGISWRDVPMLSVDLSHMREKLGCDGVLGVQDLLAEHVLRIDYQIGEITRPLQSVDEGWRLYFTQGRALISVHGAMEGGPVGLFRIDTGGSSSLLTKEYLAQSLAHGASWDVSEERDTTIKIVNEQVRQRRYVQSLRFLPCDAVGTLDLQEVPVDTTMADEIIAYAGKLGADAFKGRILELDYPASRLRLSPLD